MGSEEAPEAPQCAQALAAGQAGGHLGPQALLRPPQRPRVPPADHHRAQPPEVRADQGGGQHDLHAEARQGGRQGPHGPQLPRRLHGRRLHREVRGPVPPAVQHQGALCAAPREGRGGQVQAVPRAEGGGLQEEDPLPGHARRAHHPLPRPPREGQRLDQGRRGDGQDVGHLQVRDRQPLHDLARPQHGPRGHHPAHRAPPRVLRHRHGQGLRGQRLCDAPGQHLCARRVYAPRHLAAARQGRQAHDPGGARRARQARRQRQLSAAAAAAAVISIVFRRAPLLSPSPVVPPYVECCGGGGGGGRGACGGCC